MNTPARPYRAVLPPQPQQQTLAAVAGLAAAIWIEPQAEPLHGGLLAAIMLGATACLALLQAGWRADVTDRQAQWRADAQDDLRALEDRLGWRMSRVAADMAGLTAGQLTSIRGEMASAHRAMIRKLGARRVDDRERDTFNAAMIGEVRAIGARVEDVVAKGMSQAHWQGYAASIEDRGDDGGDGNVLPFPRH